MRTLANKEPYRRPTSAAGQQLDIYAALAANIASQKGNIFFRSACHEGSGERGLAEPTKHTLVRQRLCLAQGASLDRPTSTP